MTMEELFDHLEKKYGFKQTFGCVAFIEFTTRDGRELTLPAPYGKHYTPDQLEQIFSIWNEEDTDAIELTFNGFPN